MAPGRSVVSAVGWGCTSRIAEGRMTSRAASMSERSIFMEFSGMLFLTPFFMQCMPASVHRAVRSAPTYPWVFAAIL